MRYEYRWRIVSLIKPHIGIPMRTRRRMTMIRILLMVLSTICFFAGRRDRTTHHHQDNIVKHFLLPGHRNIITHQSTAHHHQDDDLDRPLHHDIRRIPLHHQRGQFPTPQRRMHASTKSHLDNPLVPSIIQYLKNTPTSQHAPQ
jgi:hypothetical protein